jgi:hypothetical protein
MINKITITKRVAKQGKNLIIVVPTYLNQFLKHGEIVKIDIEKLNLKEKKGE